MKKFLLALAFVLSVFIPSSAVAGSPHEVHSVTFTTNGSNVLTATAKEAGLGNIDQVFVVLTADAACVNRGGNTPNAANKQTVASSGYFPVQNGKADITLTATADLKCQSMGIEFSNELLVDQTTGVVFDSTFHCQLQSYAPNCYSGWGQRVGNCCDFYVYNESGSGAQVYFHSYHQDGSNAGDQGYVNGGSTRYFSSYGYSQGNAYATHGPYPFWVTMITNVG